MDTGSLRGGNLRWLFRMGLLLGFPAIVALPVRGEEEGGTPP